MTAFPKVGASPLTVSTYSGFSGCGALFLMASAGAAGSSTAWPSANRGIFVPIVLPSTFLLTSFFSSNGATASGNIDMGLFGTEGSLIASKGSTAQSGTSTLQLLTLTTPVLVPPGRYYMALSASSTSATFIARTPVAANLSRMGVLQAASQVPLANLPSWATPASSFLPVFGISQSSAI